MWNSRERRRRRGLFIGFRSSARQVLDNVISISLLVGDLRRMPESSSCRQAGEASSGRSPQSTGTAVGERVAPSTAGTTPVRCDRGGQLGQLLLIDCGTWSGMGCGHLIEGNLSGLAALCIAAETGDGNPRRRESRPLPRARRVWGRSCNITHGFKNLYLPAISRQLFKSAFAVVPASVRGPGQESVRSNGRSVPLSARLTAA